MPTFLIVGAAKCGTTSLYRYLNEHPDVYMSPVKEPHFFDTDTLDTSDTTGQVREYMNRHFGEPREWLRVRQLEDYQRLFEKGSAYKQRGEASTPYLYSKAAPGTIRREIPEAKIIIILREPVARAFSHHQMDLAAGVASGAFVSSLENSLATPWADWSSQYVKLGLYHSQVERYLSVFPREQVFIGFFDDLKKDTPQFFHSVCEFLGISPLASGVDLNVKHNQARAPRFRWVKFATEVAKIRGIRNSSIVKSISGMVKPLLFSPKTVERLTDDQFSKASSYFADDLKLLAKLTGRDLSPWLDGKSLDAAPEVNQPAERGSSR